MKPSALLEGFLVLFFEFSFPTQNQHSHWTICMLKSEKILLQHHKNKKQHIKKINSPWATFLWNGDTDKISFLKAELNSKTNCETLNVTSPVPSLSKQLTLTWPGLLQSLFRTQIRKKKKNSWELIKLEGRNRRAHACSKLQRAIHCMGNSACCEFCKPNPRRLLRQVRRWCKSQLAQ